MPPPLSQLWLQALLVGVIVSSIGLRTRSHPIVPAGLGAIAIVLMFVINATLCGMLTPDENPNLPTFYQRGPQGFARSVLILIGLMPYFIITPITSLISTKLQNAILRRGSEPTTLDGETYPIPLPVMIVVLSAISLWQLSMFINHDAF